MKFFKENNFITDNKLKDDVILSIKDLKVSFKTKAGYVQAVRGIDLKVKKGEIVGIVGESGSGKSVAVKSIIGFNESAKISADELNLKNIDIRSIKKNDWVYLRGSRVAYIPQDPLMSLNPTKKIKDQIIEAIKISEYRQLQWDKYKIITKLKSQDLSQNEISKLNQELIEIKQKYKYNTKSDVMYERMIDVLNYIGIENPEQRINSYPHEFSGGMRQRIVIAIAVVQKPDLIIADEPTTALDVTIQAKVLELIKKLSTDFNASIIFISHNIALVANFCDYIYVMYAGKIVEKGSCKDIFTSSAHPYTWALISSIPDTSSNDALFSISGTPPNMLSPPKGDAFAPRNKYAMKIDFKIAPPMFKLSDTHYAATWLLHKDAPRIEIPKDVIDKGAIALASINLCNKG